MKKVFNIWKKYSFLILVVFIILGVFDFRIGIAAIICMVAPVIISISKGRFWCGNLCPRGNFYDRVVIKFSNKKKVPKLLKSIYFRLAVVILMFTIFGFGVYKNWGNAYGIGLVIYRIIIVTTIVGIVLSLFFNYRTWCNFCPMGSIAAFISYFRKDKKVLEVSNSCVSCKLCDKKCPMGIEPHKYKGDTLSHPDCIQCLKCAIACPKGSISYDRSTKMDITTGCAVKIVQAMQ